MACGFIDQKNEVNKKLIFKNSADERNDRKEG